MGGVDEAKNIIAIEGMDGSNILADRRCSKQPHPQRSGIAYNPVSCIPLIVTNDINSWFLNFKDSPACQ
jgi:hypothetical protein